MTSEGIKYIKESHSKINWRENEKILGVVYKDPKKYVSYCIGRIERAEGGEKQLSACYHHAVTITLHFNGKSEEYINKFWWRKLEEENLKNLKK